MNSAGIQSSGPTGRLSPTAGCDLAAKMASPTLLAGRAEPLPIYSRFRTLSANSLVIAVLSPFIALTAGYVPRILLAMVILDIPFQFGTHLFYREEDAALGALGGLSISATTIALAGLYVSWFTRSLVNRNAEARSSLNINLPLLLYLAITSIPMRNKGSCALAARWGLPILRQPTSASRLHLRPACSSPTLDGRTSAWHLRFWGWEEWR